MDSASDVSVGIVSAQPSAALQSQKQVSQVEV